MGTLREILEIRRGIYRASFAGTDLGELAAPPEIRADYSSTGMSVHPAADGSRRMEGEPELRAKIVLKLKALHLALSILDDPPSATALLRLHNPDRRHSATLDFPVSRLLPVWEFAPSFTGDHLITVHFHAAADQTGRLFYYSGT